MPRRSTSIKTQRSIKRKHLRNLKVKIELKKTLKKFQGLVSAKKLDEAKALLKTTFSKLDKAAKKGIIPVNRANRKKSRLSLKLLKGA
ncbi:MAG: 30S ribosomal protein S20 [Candidatus Omnitrophica bacterium]|nr:30S ribosomal protein S20 [Candidatus Omnitrophota bacterium]